jgi:hypothetical protein
MPDTDTKDPATRTTETEPGAHHSTETQVEEVPWSDRDVDLLAIALQTTGPFVLGNDVRSPESARGVAVQLLELFEACGFNQPKPKKDVEGDRLEVFADELREQRAGNQRTPPTYPEHTPTPTEQRANERRRLDETDEKGSKEDQEQAEIRDKHKEEREKEASQRHASRQSPTDSTETSSTTTSGKTHTDDKGRPSQQQRESDSEREKRERETNDKLKAEREAKK